MSIFSSLMALLPIHAMDTRNDPTSGTRIIPEAPLPVPVVKGVLSRSPEAAYSELCNTRHGVAAAPRPHCPSAPRYRPVATIIGAVVGWGLPPIGSSVTATAASESFGIAYVARIITSPSGFGMNVPALIFAVGVTSHS
jgi:hypothetical protein